MSVRSSSIADKLFYGVLALLVIVLGGLGSFLIHQRVKDVGSRLDRRIETEAHYLARILPPHVSRLSAKEIREAIESVVIDELEAVEIFDVDGNRLYVYERAGPKEIFYEKAIGDDLIMDGRRVGKFTAYFSKRAVMANLRQRELLNLVLLISGVGLALGGGISILVKRLIVNPVEKAKDFSAELAAGNYDRRIAVASGDELGILQDSLNRMAQSLETSVQQLIEASRLKSEFLANLSHEIRTPMNAVIGFVDILLVDEPHEERRESLRTIKKSANILLETIDQILHFSKIKSGELKLNADSFLMADLVEEIAPIIKQKLYGKEVSFDVNLGEGLHEPFCCDHLRLRQILLNLLINSAKFTPRGRIALSVNLIPENTAIFRIADTGIGIPKEEHERVFEPFAQVDASHTRHHGGTGLGLAISRQLVELMGGEIWIESEPGDGTTVVFTIPRQSGEEAHK